MKELVILGARIETTDDIADAVIELAAAMARHGLLEVVEFPCVHHGSLTTASIVLGEPYMLAAVRVPGSAPGEVDGSASIVEELRRRTSELAAI